MTEHELEWLRGQVRWGLSEWIVDRERPDRPTPRLHATKTKNDEITGQRIDPELVRATESRGFKKSAVLCGPFAFGQSAIVRAVNCQQDGIREWLRYAYGQPVPMWADVEVLVAEVWRQWQQENQEKLLPASIKLMKALAFLAVQDARIVVNGGREKPQTEIADLANKSHTHWRKGWAPRWRLLQQIVAGMDIQGLSGVCNEIDRRRHDRNQDRYAANA